LNEVLEVNLNTFSEFNSNYLSYVKATVEFCNEVTLLDNPLTKRIFETLYHNKLPSYIEPLSEWRKYYIELCINVCDKVLTFIPNYAPYAFVLLLSISKEALHNTIETLYSCVNRLSHILLVYPTALPQFIQKEHATIIDLTIKLLLNHYDKLLDHDKPFINFITQVYPLVSPYLTPEKRNHILTNFQSHLQKTSEPPVELTRLLSFLKEH